jgi:hypothetical protein
MDAKRAPEGRRAPSHPVTTTAIAWPATACHRRRTSQGSAAVAADVEDGRCATTTWRAPARERSETQTGLDDCRGENVSTTQKY